MLSILRERLRQGRRTIAYPAATAPVMPDRYRGLPVLEQAKCADGCSACVDSCPTEAITRDDRELRLDLGRCLFCGECVAGCPEGTIRFSQDYRLAARTRDALVIRSGQPYAPAWPIEAKRLRLFGRSLKLRHVSAGSDNACEADLSVLNSIVFDMSRFGVEFVASPRHADGLVVTGPITRNMREALLSAYEAMPAPKLVIAVGTEAISGALFRGHPEVHNGLEGILPIDLYIPGWPPHPMTVLDGFLRLLNRLDKTRDRLPDRLATLREKDAPPPRAPQRAAATAPKGKERTPQRQVVSKDKDRLDRLDQRLASLREENTPRR